MLDSKTLDFTKRLIQADIKKRRASFYKELSQTKRKLQLSGNSPETSSQGKKMIFELFTQELEAGASIVWRNLQRAHKALGSQITETLASNFKEAVTHLLSEITKELSGFMIKQPCFAKDDTANSNLYLAENDAREKINIEIDLYASNLMQKSKKWYQTKVFKGAVIALVVTLLGGGIPAWLSLGDKTINIVISNPSLEAEVKRITDEQTDKLTRKYPRGNIVFGVTQKGFIVPKGLVPPTSKIQWDTGKVLEFTEKSIKVLLPHMIINTESVKGTQIAGAVVSLPKVVNAKRGLLKLPEIRIQAEVIGLHDQMVIIGVGFIPINNEDDSNTTKQ